MAPHPRGRETLLGLTFLLTACVPDVGVDLSRVDELQVLALRADPPEAAPGEMVQLDALVADASGTIADAPIEWAFCLGQRPLAELGPVDRDCLDESSTEVALLGVGPSAAGVLPDRACRYFGPEPPPALPGEPVGRPVDPDLTGGYYQPLRARTQSDDAIVSGVRLVCGLAGATMQQAADFRRRYVRNTAPQILRITADEMELVEGDVLTVIAGEPIVLRVNWSTCSDDPRACNGAETYLRFDPLALAIATQREAMSVAWFATGGTFAAARTGRGPSERDAWTENTWTAPADASEVTLWIVVRDDRGGVGWRTVPLVAALE